MKISTRIATGALLMGSWLSNGAYAQEPWIVRLAFETGGDDLIGVVFTNGDTEEIQAGGLAHFEGGKQFRLLQGNQAMVTELTAGYKIDRVTATNGDMAFSRISLNAVQYYQYSEKVRIGAGVTYHLNPTLDVNFPGINAEAETDDALGFMLALDYAFSDNGNIGIRGTQIDYEIDGGEFSGNSIGGYATFYF